MIVASSFEHVLAFMGDKLKDKARWKTWNTAQQARVECRVTGTRVHCIGNDPRRAHGLAPVQVLADEPAQWPETTGERMAATRNCEPSLSSSSRLSAFPRQRVAEAEEAYGPKTSSLRRSYSGVPGVTNGASKIRMNACADPPDLERFSSDRAA